MHTYALDKVEFSKGPTSSWVQAGKSASRSVSPPPKKVTSEGEEVDGDEKPDVKPADIPVPADVKVEEDPAAGVVKEEVGEGGIEEGGSWKRFLGFQIEEKKEEAKENEEEASQ